MAVNDLFFFQNHPYRNENVAALELQYCGSRVAIKF